MDKIAAFFDVDETIINLKSMFSFYDYWCREKDLTAQHREYAAKFKRDVQQGKPRELLNQEYYQQFRNVSLNELNEYGQKWFHECLNKDNFIAQAVAELRSHQEKGTIPVFVSGSMLPVLQPIADALDVNVILCAPLIIDDQGCLTGEIGKPQTIGTGKKEAILSFCRGEGFRPEYCYAYGDDISDIPMLEATGHPVCVGSNKKLLDYAALKGWRNI